MCCRISKPTALHSANRDGSHKSGLRVTRASGPVGADDNLTLSSSKRGQVGRPFEHEARLKEFLAEQAQLSITSCAGSSRFWEMRDKLYADYTKLSRLRIFAFAKEIGLDRRFRSDLESHRLAGKIQSERHEGETVGVEGTPTFFINGRKLNRAFSVMTVGPLIATQ